MISGLYLKIKQYLADYTEGKISLQTFQKWFIPVTWDIENRKEPETELLVYEIILRLAEYTNKDWTEEELKLKLKSLDNIYNIEKKMSLTSIVKYFAMPGRQPSFGRKPLLAFS
jgi:hypothetical protein